MEINLTKVFRSDKNKEGKPLMTKDGRPYTKLAIKAQEYGDKWLSGFDGYATKNWKEGDKVEVEVEQKGEYLNFKVQSQQDKAWTAIAALSKKILQMEVEINRLKTGTPPVDGFPLNRDADIPVINDEDIPF